MNDPILSEALTGRLSEVEGVSRLYRTGALGGLQAIVTRGEPTASVSTSEESTVVVANLGVTTARPACATLVEAADAVVAQLRSDGVVDRDVTLRVCRIL
ncbi:hypothetical protein NY547_15200 [Cnuibacter physcomitrellae]|uniref:hypothetical protein n=1 Tax=Cnuibacter physcomitrellae TaxID=1619308 RepID=UPI0021757741|nr:hypothetical protein [Cnuibacter physcomitrellae]MCS5498596.1 hypothetical protein [Cnuibacter physcomitrellae]